MAARKRKTKEDETTANAVVSNPGEDASAGPREPKIEQVNETTRKVTY